MKRFLKSFFVYAACAALILSCALFIPVDVSAVESQSDGAYLTGWYLIRWDISSSSLPEYLVFEGLVTVYFPLLDSPGFGLSHAPDEFYLVPMYSFTCGLVELRPEHVGQPTSVYLGVADIVVAFDGIYEPWYPPAWNDSLEFNLDNGTWIYLDQAWVDQTTYEFLETYCYHWEPAGEGDPVLEGGLYNSLFSMFSRFLYGEGAQIDGWQQMFTTFLTSIAMIVMFALPFVVVWFLLRLFGVVWR